MDLGLVKLGHTNVWGDLTRSQLRFIRDQIDAYLLDTSADDNWVYLMQCGHEIDSPYRLSRSSRVTCSQHGFQYLATHSDDGTPLTRYDFLPDYIPPKTRKVRRNGVHS
jgi:hypothetical protein